MITQQNIFEPNIEDISPLEDLTTENLELPIESFDFDVDVDFMEKILDNSLFLDQILKEGEEGQNLEDIFKDLLIEKPLKESINQLLHQYSLLRLHGAQPSEQTLNVGESPKQRLNANSNDDPQIKIPLEVAIEILVNQPYQQDLNEENTISEETIKNLMGPFQQNTSEEFPIIRKIEGIPLAQPVTIEELANQPYQQNSNINHFINESRKEIPMVSFINEHQSTQQILNEKNTNNGSLLELDFTVNNVVKSDTGSEFELQNKLNIAFNSENKSDFADIHEQVMEPPIHLRDGSAEIDISELLQPSALPMSLGTNLDLVPFNLVKPEVQKKLKTDENKEFIKEQTEKNSQSLEILEKNKDVDNLQEQDKIYDFILEINKNCGDTIIGVQDDCAGENQLHEYPATTDTENAVLLKRSDGNFIDQKSLKVNTEYKSALFKNGGISGEALKRPVNLESSKAKPSKRASIKRKMEKESRSEDEKETDSSVILYGNGKKQKPELKEVEIINSYESSSPKTDADNCSQVNAPLGTRILRRSVRQLKKRNTYYNHH